MYYNVSFDIAAVLILLVVYVSLNTVLKTATKRTALFRQYVVAVMANAALDIITAYTIEFGNYVPDRLNLILNTIYQICSAVTVFIGIQYIFAYIENTRKPDLIIKRVVFIIYLLFLILNVPAGYIFSFADGKYIHGSLFYGTFGISYVVVIYALVVTVLRYKQIGAKKVWYSFFFLLMPSLFTVFQIIFPSVLLNSFGQAFATLILLFTLETPDYNKLIKTLEELNEAKNEADIANNAKSGFLANMSHEIRTPINGILGMDQMILQESKDPNILGYAENIKTAGVGLLSIINDILDFSKIESGKMTITPTEYKLFSMLRDEYQLIRMRAEDKGLLLEFTNNPKLSDIMYGDELRVRQVLNNILTNAIKYTEKGSVRLHADFEKKVEGVEVFLVISVTDTGAGIKEEDIEKLFESFKRIEEEKNRNIEGTGLGLRITKQLVELMNGTIEVSSVYGEGSTFTVRIPQGIRGEECMGDFNVRMSEKAEVEEKEEAQVPDLAGKRILSVDDVKMNQIVLRGFLKDTEAVFDMASSGFECLEKIKKEKYDLIFMDHLMPEMDGIETFRKMMATEDNLNMDTPVVIVTANALVGEKEKYLRIGFMDYLPKPVDRAKLLETAEKYINCY